MVEEDFDHSLQAFQVTCPLDFVQALIWVKVHTILVNKTFERLLKRVSQPVLCTQCYRALVHLLKLLHVFTDYLATALVFLTEIEL